MDINTSSEPNIDDIFSDLDLDSDSDKTEKVEQKAEELKPQQNDEKAELIKKVVEKTEKDLFVSSDTKELIRDFLDRYINILNAKKQIALDIKALKQEFIEKGIAVAIVVKAFNDTVKRAKMSYSQSNEIEGIQSMIESDKLIMDKISDYIQKD